MLNILNECILVEMMLKKISMHEEQIKLVHFIDKLR